MTEHSGRLRSVAPSAGAASPVAGAAAGAGSPGASDTAATSAVDTDQLAQVIPLLHTLREYVATTLRESVSKVSDTLGDHQVTFGAFGDATSAAGKHDAFRTTVVSAYDRLAQRLAHTAEATQKILDNYRTVEERNQATAAQIQSLLTDGDITGTGGSATPGAATSGNATPPATASGPTLTPQGSLPTTGTSSMDGSL